MADEENVIGLIGELIGEVKGIQLQIAQANDATNKRIDDLSASVREQSAALNRRLEDHQRDTDERLKDLAKRVASADASAQKAIEIATEAKASKSQIAVASSGSSALVLAASELIRALVSS